MSKPLLLLLSGKKQSGKDTCAEYLKKYDFTRYAYADKLKQKTVALVNHFFGGIESGDITLEYFNDVNLKEKEVSIKGVGSITPRKLLQVVGTDFIRHLSDNYWVNLVMEDIITNSIESNIVVTDCRFPNEIRCMESMLNNFRVKTVRIKRYSPNTPFDSHPSETGLDFMTDTDFDYVLNNFGDVDQFKKAIDDMVGYFNG